MALEQEQVQAPTLPAADALGNPSPAAMARAQQPTGVDTLSNPQSTQATQDLSPVPASGGANLFQRMSASNSPHLKKMTDAIGSAVKANPQVVNKPGGLTRLLVGGAIEALSGASSAMNSLGDVAAVGTVPEGAGGLTGAARTLAARNQRQRQQKLDLQDEDKNKLLMAEANSRMVHEQRVVHNMDDEQIQKSVDSSIPIVNKLKSGASPAPVIAEDLTSDELKQYMQQNKIDATKETSFPTGRRVVGEDKDGLPIYRTTYTAMGVPAEVTLDPENEDDKKLLSDMNKYAPPSQGKWGTTGKQTMTGQQFNWVMQETADNRAKTSARDKTLVDQQLEDRDTARKREAVTFGGTDWTRALAGAPKNDPIAARNAILRDPKLAAKYPNLDSDLRSLYGDKNYDKMLDDYQKKVDSGMEQITDIQKKLDTAHGEEAASLAEGFQAKIDDPSTPPDLKQRYTRMKDQANKQAKASSGYTEDLKRREAAAEQAASTGDMSQVRDMALNYEIDPDKLFSKFKGLAEKQKFLAEMHREDPAWSESEYKARYNTVNDFRPEGKGGIAKQSLNAFGGHVGDANGLVESLRNTGSPLLNTPLNKFKEGVLGQPQFIAYKAAVSAAADEYINFLLNQKAKHTSDDDLAAKLTSDTISPGMAQSLFRQMANTIAIRARALNKGYRDQMGGKDIPNFLDPDTEKVLQDFGIDPKSITNKGTSGLVKTNPQAAPPSVPQGATLTYKDAQGNVKGWAVNGKYVPAGQ